MNPKASLNYDSSRKNWLYYLFSHCLAQSDKAVIFLCLILYEMAVYKQWVVWAPHQSIWFDLVLCELAK